MKYGVTPVFCFQILHIIIRLTFKALLSSNWKDLKFVLELNRFFCIFSTPPIVPNYISQVMSFTVFESLLDFAFHLLQPKRTHLRLFNLLQCHWSFARLSVFVPSLCFFQVPCHLRGRTYCTLCSLLRNRLQPSMAFITSEKDLFLKPTRTLWTILLFSEHEDNI